jgi:hypothetical protein
VGAGRGHARPLLRGDPGDLAIFIWHLYYVIINPDFAPMSLTWIDGKLSRHHMEHEHPLELEEIEDEERRGPAKAPGTTRIVTEDS